MSYWFVFLLLLTVPVFTKEDSYEIESEELEVPESCGPKCTGIEYKCINGACYCSDGFYHNYFQAGCIKCPALGEKCFGTCCNESLQCWHGKCQPCYDSHGKWACRDTVDQILLISTTQVVMGTALVLGIVATLVLLSRLCATASLRPLGSGSNNDGRLSIGSLQMYVDERLRDAPPRYSRTAPVSIVVTQMPAVYQNDCFVHDSSVPPPPYTEIKHENSPIQNSTVHI